MTAVASSLEMPATPGATEDDRVLPGGWYTLFAMMIIVLFAFVDRQLLILAAQPLSESLSLTDSQLGLIQGLAFSIFSVVAVYPIAWLADRYDRRLILGACLVLWSFGTVGCGLAQNFWQLFIAAVAIASGEAALGPLAMAFVPDLFKGRKRVLANSIQYIFTYIGASLAMGMGGSALGVLDRAHAGMPSAFQHLESWRLAFLLVCLPTPLLLMLLARTRLGKTNNVADTAAPSAPPVPIAGFLREHRAAFLSILGGLGFYMLAYGGFMVWLPLIGSRLFGATPEINGYGMGLSSAVGTCFGVATGTLLMRFYMPRLGTRAAVGVSWRLLLLTCPVLAIFPFVQSVTQLYICMGVMMLAGTGVGCLVATTLQVMAPAHFMARFFGIWSIISALLSGASPSIAGFVSDAIGGQRGLLYAVVLVAACGWLAAIVLLRLGERHFEDLVKSVKEAA
ncbi:MFS transporter (plasmid) [Novosphingobium resinovorum]|uniref:MFS transporter n=1 Tax=Novosphingobium TaxID=165696 RepID=UPI001B3C65C9|nr:MULTISPECIES: MFS transporter [Novosphingobium]MBF7015277.1 MFS transporter [Novosphingobium sp. HR1a]WJM29953.1 MFS transporter [Novosphingobium resinovorum]